VSGARRLLVTILGLIGVVSTAGAYSHFVHYTGRTAPYNPAQEKFDLNALPNKTVTFFVSDSAAGAISRPDQFPSVLNLIREAARTWNGVETSDLRVAFGGLASSSAPQNTPGTDIIFDEMDPLLLGLTSTNARNAISFGAGGAFVPITRPLIRLNRNLSSWSSTSAGPSFTEAFFLTAVHEMGHALGLQHTFTASAMSTDITRTTSLYSPLTPDDIAGISYLYPRNFGAATGSITGRVTIGGQGAHLASVVAIQPSGPAISALTDPDGRYRIDGVPSGAYYVYAHPLPPGARAGAAPGDIWLPVDPDGAQKVAEGPFDTLFYQVSSSGGTRDYNQATLLFVNHGTVTDNVNFSTNRRSAYSIPSVTTYSYFDQTAVRPGFVNGRGTLVASGAGLTSNGAITPGLNVSVMGGAAILGSGALYAYGGAYVAMDLVANFGINGPRHLIYSLPNDVYVQPNGLSLVQNRPPVIISAAPAFESNGARSVALAGTTINPDTKFFFDGVPATVLHFDDATRPFLAPPPGISGQRSVITAFNPDGQNSMFTQANAPAAYTYDTGDSGFVTISPNSLAAGTESFVEITGNGNFVDATLLGFGSSDVQVRRVWVVARNKIWANVWVAPAAPSTSIPITLISGFQVVSQPFAVQIVSLAGRPALTSQVVNAAPPLSGIYVSATVTVSGANLANGTLTLGDRPVTVVASNSSQITFVVPSGLTPGPAILKFSNGPDTASIVVQIDPTPPDVRTVLASSDVTINASRPARPGDVLNVIVASLADPNAVLDSRRVRVNISGVDHPALSITPRSGVHQVQVILSSSVGSGAAPLTVSMDGHGSLPYSIPVVH